MRVACFLTPQGVEPVAVANEYNGYMSHECRSCIHDDDNQWLF